MCVCVCVCMHVCMCVCMYPLSRRVMFTWLGCAVLCVLPCHVMICHNEIVVPYIPVTSTLPAYMVLFFSLSLCRSVSLSVCLHSSRFSRAKNSKQLRAVEQSLTKASQSVTKELQQDTSALNTIQSARLELERQVSEVKRDLS